MLYLHEKICSASEIIGKRLCGKLLRFGFSGGSCEHGVSSSGGRRGFFGCFLFEGFLGECVPIAALRASAHPFCTLIITFRAYVNCFCFFHLSYLSVQRMKFVLILGSYSGYSTPAALPASMDRRSQIMFCASTRTVCKPSSSWRTSSGVLPCT